MKTIADAVDHVYGIAKTLGIPTFKYTSTGNEERLVVNSLPMTGYILQRCYVNVNGFVPDITVAGDASVPDTKRLGEVQALLINLFEGANGAGDIHIYIESQGVERNRTMNEHFVNIKLKVNLTN